MIPIIMVFTDRRLLHHALKPFQKNALSNNMQAPQKVVQHHPIDCSRSLSLLGLLRLAERPVNRDILIFGLNVYVISTIY